MVNAISKGFALPPAHHAKQEGSNAADPIDVAVDNYQIINQLMGVIQEMQITFQD